MKLSIETNKQNDKVEIVKFTIEGDPDSAGSEEAEYWALVKALFSEKVQIVRHPSLVQRVLRLW